MEDINKTKEILLSELIVLRQRLTELEAGEQKPQTIEHILRERIKELQCIYAITQIRLTEFFQHQYFSHPHPP